MIDISTMILIVALLLIIFGLVLLTMAMLAQGKRIQTLEEQLPKRHTHQNAMTLENLAALVIGAQARTAESQKMLDALREIIATWRQDPSYRSKE